MTPEVIPPGTRPRLSSRASVQMDKITGKPVLLYPEGALILNPTGHAILSLCNGQSTLGQITPELATRYGVSTQKISVQVTDVDKDGLPDLLLRFRFADTGIRPSDLTACLTGELDKVPFEGCDLAKVQGR